MKWILPPLLLLAACNSEQGADAAEEGAQDADPVLEAANMVAGTAAAETAKLEAKLQSAMAVILRDPGSARYSNVRSGAGGSVCGEVDSKQESGRHGGPRPFVVTPEGVAVVSSAPAVSYDDPEDVFPDFYLRWCATPEELQRVGPRLQTASPPPDLNDIPDIDESLFAEGEVPAAQPPPLATTDEPAAGLDDFSNAVIRKR
jgi:hypothetical protein